MDSEMKLKLGFISNKIYSLMETILEYVKHSDSKNASNLYQKHKKPKLLANKSKVNFDTNAKYILLDP